ncbi:Vba1 protein [Starmerella bacillaris]|uniref:Vba1 protein n=1 Tax=Starmerella bacillaris TaxID=1247836 RepID=A0AAV5RH06_STABA|nr:Vba1 protein [Starmerella bacillaris]
MATRDVGETTPLISQPEVSASDAAEPIKLSKFRLILLFSTLYFGVMLAAIDTTIVSTLLGHIGSDLNALDSVSWIAAGYTVAYSAFQPLYGKFSDIWGRKHVSITCTAMFAIGCAICGVAPGLKLLVFGRFVSGVGAGGMLSMSTVTVSDYVSLRSRGIFQGIGNVCFGVGASLGSVLGGWITAYSGWRTAFTAQVPPIILAIIAQFILLKEKPVLNTTSRKTWERIDWLGSFTLVSSLLMFMLAITTGGVHFNWVSWQMLLMLSTTVALFSVFWYAEKHIAIEPVMPLDILMHKTIFNACLTNFISSGAVFAFIFYCPIFLQALYHYSYIVVGHRIVANFAGVVTGSLGSGIIMRRTGKYHSLGVRCCSLMTLGSLILLLTPYVGPGVAGSAVYQSLSYFLTGVGYSGMLTVTLLALIAAVDPQFQATTTAAQYTFRGAGSSLGIAIAAAIFSNVLNTNLIRKIGVDTDETAKIVDTVSKSLEAIWDQPAEFQPSIIASYKNAGLAVLAFTTACGLIAIFTCSQMDEHDLERRPPAVTSSDHSDSLQNNEAGDLPRASTPPGPLVGEP